MTTSLKPRKTPLQGRSTATVEALHIAVIQVLTAEGLARCTTTRVAERAGVSVGSLYQYYPNRDALLAAVLERHLGDIAEAVERACRGQHGRPLADMAQALVRAFLAAKLRNPDESKALYAVATDRGGPAVAARLSARLLDAIAAMLSSAGKTSFDDPRVTAAVILGAIVGPVRALLEGHMPVDLAVDVDLEAELIRLVGAYLRS